MALGVALALVGLPLAVLVPDPAPAAAAPVAAGTVTRYPGVGKTGRAALGADGNVWFTSTSNDAIGRITPAGTIDVFQGAAISAPTDIAAGPDGALWFVNSGSSSIGRITTSGVSTSFDAPQVTNPAALAAGPDGAVWFTNWGNPSVIGRITPAGAFSFFSDAAMSYPRAITAGPDGALWFVNSGSSSIGRITTGGATTYVPLPNVSAYDMTFGPDGNLWFTTRGINGVGVRRADGTVSTYATSATYLADDIVVGPDGALWYSSQEPFLGRITTAGVSSQVATLFPAATGIVIGADGNFWLPVSGAVKRVTPAGASTMYPGRNVSNVYAMIKGPDGAVWFTNRADGSVNRISSSGVVTSYHRANVPATGPLTAGPDGSIWFATDAGLGRLTVGGFITPYPAYPPLGDVVVGPDGALWFGTSTGVARMTTAGTTTLFPVGGVVSPAIVALASGPDGNLWFTSLTKGAVFKMTTAGVSTLVAPGLTGPLVVGPDGALWTTRTPTGGPHAIVRVTTAGAVTEFTGPEITSPSGLAFAEDGGLWFNASSSSTPSRWELKRMAPDGTVIRVPTLSVAGSAKVDPGDGYLWFGDDLAVSKVVVLGSPGAPGTPAAVRGNASATVSWAAGLDGGSPITGYTVTASPGGATCTTNGTTTCTVTGLQNGTPYTFTVVATTAVGTGPSSPASDPVVPATTPAAPGNVTATAGDHAATVTWAASPSDGGLPLTGYVVTASPGGATCSALSTALSCTVAGLTVGTGYTFAVQGVNALGAGLPSAPSTVVVPWTVPGPPMPINLVAGDGAVTVSWMPPTANGSGPITGYIVQSATPGVGCTAGPAATSCTVTGLTNNTYVYVRVAAVTADGTGAWSYWSFTVPFGVPGAPGSVTATAGSSSAAVTWAAAASNGSPITSYTATATPGGTSCTVTVWVAGGGCVVGGLVAGTSYTFTVTATNARGTGPASAPSGPVVPWSGSGFHPMAPTRFLDSRTAVGGWQGTLASGAPRTVQINGVAGIPTTATAVVMNVTVTNPTAGSYLTVWPTGVDQPGTANLNFTPGQTVPNLVTVRVGAGGKVSFANAVGSTDVVADVVGWYDDGTAGGDLFDGMPPTRFLDSRTAVGGWSGPLVAGASRTLQVRGAGGVPATATAVVANITVTGGTAGSYLTAWPSGVAQPTAANLSFGPAQTTSNLAVVRLGADGAIQLANAVGLVDVVIDVVGWYDSATGARFHAVNPVRVLDDRIGLALTGPWTAGATRTFSVSGASGVPLSATVVVANLTATGGTAGSYLTAFPGGAPRPTAASLLFGPGQTVAGLTMVKTGPDATVSIYNQLGKVDVVADVVGWFGAV